MTDAQRAKAAEVAEAYRQEIARLRAIAAAARAYVDSDPPRPEWRALVVALADAGPSDHEYTSTACVHDLHAACRVTCKFCAALCRCGCHA